MHRYADHVKAGAQAQFRTGGGVAKVQKRWREKGEISEGINNLFIEKKEQTKKILIFFKEHYIGPENF